MSSDYTNPDFDFPGFNLKQGSAGQLASLRVNKQYIFSTLPATPTLGWIAVITDSNTNVWGANVAGGGANKILAWYNGTNWTVLGK